MDQQPRLVALRVRLLGEDAEVVFWAAIAFASVKLALPVWPLRWASLLFGPPAILIFIVISRNRNESGD